MMQNPWAGLSSYEDPAKSTHKLKFCGRDSDTFDVTRLIDDNFFVTLYGKSGIGKTSLLNAGVFPALRREHYTPLSLRLGMTEEGESFQTIITTAVERALQETGGSILTIPVVDEQKDKTTVDFLWNWFARRQFLTADEQTTFPVIVFDQFEEVFRQSEMRAKTEVLLAQIHYLIDESHALSDCIVAGEEYTYDFNFRFVVSIREDDLYRLEDSIDNCTLTALKRCRYRLRSLSEEGARAAIIVPGEGLFRPEEQDQIEQTIIGIARNKEEQSISTNLLSLVCNRIFVDFQKRADADFISQSLVDTFVKDNPFERFYEEATKGFSNKEKGYIEDHLVDSTGRRNSMPESDFLLHVPNGTTLLEGDTRILQRSSVSTDGGNYRIELIHDSFCEPLSKQREKREKRRRVRMFLFVSGISIIFLILSVFSLFYYLKAEKKTEEAKENAKIAEMKTNEAEENARIAEENKQKAEEKEQETKETNKKLEKKIKELKAEREISLKNRARYLAEVGQTLIDDHDSYTAQLLALSILPNSLEKPDKPYVVEAEELLRNASKSKNGVLHGHNSSVRAVAINPNGTRIASVSDNNTLIVWDMASGKPLLRQSLVIPDGLSRIISIVFSQSGDSVITIATPNNVCYFWNPETGEQIGTSKTQDNYVSSLLLKHNNMQTSHYRKDIYIDETRNDTLKGHTKDVLSAVFSPDGKHIVSGSSDKTVRIWDIDTVSGMGESYKQINNYINFAYISPDGKWIVSEDDKGIVRINEVGSDRTYRYFKSKKNITSNVFSPDGKWIIINDGDTIHIWDTEIKQTVRQLQGGDFFVFTPDGKKLMLLDNLNDLYIKDILTAKQSRQHIQIDSSKKINQILFSPNGKWIVSIYDDATMCVFDAQTGNPTGQPSDVYPSLIKAIAFSPDSKTAIWQKDDGVLCLLDINKQTSEKLSWTSSDYDIINSISFSVDGQQIVSTHADGNIRIWDVKTGKQLCKPLSGSTKGGLSAIFHKSRNRILSVFRDGTIRIWDFPPLQDLINETRKRFKDRNLTPEERKKYYLE